MDDLDHQLIRLLQKDSRLPVASLAAALDVARATVKARIDRLLNEGVIERFTLQLGAPARDATVRAMISIQVQGRLADQVCQALLRIAQVQTVHSTNGRWDFIAELEARDLPTFDETLRKIRLIDGIAVSESDILLSTRRSRVL